MLPGRHRAGAASPSALDIKRRVVVPAIWGITSCDGDLASSLVARLSARPQHPFPLEALSPRPVPVGVPRLLSRAAGRTQGCAGCDLPGGGDGATLQGRKYQLLAGSEDFSLNPLEIGALSRGSQTHASSHVSSLSAREALPGRHRGCGTEDYTPPGCPAPRLLLSGGERSM